ncbi:MAG: hypothetical protein HUJ75_02805, partial [Parasporobacterium sp.]|nr:hypothetical protein [Parasporobacterium sp.]
MSSGTSKNSKKRHTFVKSMISIFTVLILVLAFSAFTFADETEPAGQNAVVDTSLKGEGPETETKDTSSVSGTLNIPGETSGDNIPDSSENKTDNEKINAPDDTSVKQNNEKLNDQTENTGDTAESAADIQTEQSDKFNENINSESLNNKGTEQNTNNEVFNENISNNSPTATEQADALTPMLADASNSGSDISLTDKENAEEDPGTVTIQGVLVEKTADDGSKITVLEKLEGLDTNVFLNKSETADDKAMAIEKAIKAAAEQAKKLNIKGSILISLTHGDYSDEVDLTDTNPAFSKKVNPETYMDLTGLNFTLVSADCYSVDEYNGNAVTFDKSKAVKGANLSGALSFTDITMTLYGVYLSLSKITAKNSDVTIVGTTDADTISVDISSYDTPDIEISGWSISKEEFDSEDSKHFSLKIDGNDGNDTITVNQSGYAYQGKKNSAGTAYDINPHDEAMTIDIDGGKGNDTITVTSAGSQKVNTTIKGGKGNDNITVTASSNTVKLEVENTEEYDYKIDEDTKKVVIDKTTKRTTKAVNRKEEANYQDYFKKSVTIFDDSDINETNNIKVTIAAGVVDVFINTFTNTSAVPASGAVSTGFGNDVISVEASSDDVKNGSVSIYAGDGNDTVSIDALLGSATYREKDSSGADQKKGIVVIDGGLGLNTIKLTGELTTKGIIDKIKTLIKGTDPEVINEDGWIVLIDSNDNELVIKANNFFRQGKNEFNLLDRLYNKNSIEVVDLKLSDGSYVNSALADQTLYVWIKTGTGEKIFDYSDYIDMDGISGNNLKYTNIVFELDDYFKKHGAYVSSDNVSLPSFQLGINSNAAAGIFFDLCQFTIHYTGSETDGKELIINDITVAAMPLLINIGKGEYHSTMTNLAVTVTGTVSAPDISIVVYNSDSVAGAEVNGESIDVPNDPDASVGDKLYDSLAGFGFFGDAAIYIASTGKLQANLDGGIVDISTEVEYTRALLDFLGLLDGLNIVNFKVTNSTIDIMGELAGYIVRANAKSTIKLMAKNDLAQLANNFVSVLAIPVAVSVGLIETTVTLHGKDAANKAVIKAGNEFTMGAIADVKVDTVAGSSQAPVAIAVTVLDNLVSASVGDYVEIQKNTGAANPSEADIILIATGSSEINNVAQKGSLDKGSSGGYAAVTVSTQNVTADITGNAVITAKSLSQSATSKEKITNKATSARPGEDKGGQKTSDAKTFVTFILDIVKAVFTRFKDIVMGPSTPSDKKEKKKDAVEKKFKTAQETLDSTAGTKLELGSSEHGTVSASAYKVKSGDTITITVSPEADYDLDTLTISFVNENKEKIYINYKGEPFKASDENTGGDATKRIIGGNNGSASLTGAAVKADGFNYVIFLDYNNAFAKTGYKLLEGTTISIEAEFKEAAGRQKGDDLGNGGNAGITVDDVLNDVITSKTDANRATESLKYENNVMDTAGVQVVIDETTFQASQGIVSIDAVPCKNPGNNDEYWFKPGQGVKLNITGLVEVIAGTQNKIKWSVDSVSIKFMDDNGTSQSLAVTANEKGEYVFSVPSLTKDTNKKITVQVKFTKDKKVSDGKAGSVQLTGAFAVAVVTNNASASISGSPVITLSGALKNTSGATTELTNSADARAAQPSDDSGSGSGSENETAPTPIQINGGTVNDTVKIIDIINGSVIGNTGKGYKVEILDDGNIKDYDTFVADHDNNDKNAQKVGVDYLFSFGVRLGYKIDTVFINFKNTALEEMQVELIEYDENGRYWWRYGMLINPETKQWEKPRYGLAMFGEAFEVNVIMKAVDGGATLRVVAPNETEASKKGSAEVSVGHIINKATGKYSITDRNTPDKGDMVVFTLNAAEGCFIDISDATKAQANVKIYYKDGNTDKAFTYIDENTAWDFTKNQYKFKDGYFTFVMPDAFVYIEANFQEKTNNVKYDSIKVTKTKEDGSTEEIKTNKDDKDGLHTYIKLSDTKKVANGEKYTVSLLDKAINEGWRFDDDANKAVTVSGIDNTNKAAIENEIKTSLAANNYRSFTVTLQGLTGDFFFEANLRLAKNKVEYEIAEDAEKAGCKIEGTKFADPGDKVTVTVTEADATDDTPAYGFDGDTLMMVITIKDNTGAERGVGLAATANRDGSYYFTVPKDLLDSNLAEEITSIKVTGEFAEGKKNGTRLNVGTGIAVTVLNQTSRSDIKENRTIAVKSLTVDSSNTVTAKNEAFAGFSSGNFGIAGAISVLVGNAKASSTIVKGNSNDSITIGAGDVNVTSKSQETVTVTADSTGSKTDKTGKGTGVGAAIAVDVFSGTVDSEIEDGTKLINKDSTSATSVTVSADQTRKETITAKAGASGGTSVVPVVAVAVTTAKSSAVFGKGHDTSKLSVGTVSVLATANLTRSLTADASASGDSVGVGGSFSVSVINDVTRSRLSRNLTVAKNVTVRSKEKSTVTSNAKAGAQGSKSAKKTGKSEDSDGDGPDKQAASLLQGAAGLGGSSINKADQAKQKSETTEGSISVAAAFVLNIQKSYVESFISEGVEIASTGDVSVESLAQIDSRINANGSATKSKNGVGVAVAINIINYENLAYIEKAKISAKNLKVYAGVIQPDKPKKQEDVKDDDEEEENYLVEIIKGWIESLTKTLIEKAGLSKTIANIIKDALNMVVESVVGEDGENLTELLDGTGLEPLVTNNPKDTILKNLDEKLGVTLKGLDPDIKSKFIDILKEKLLPGILEDVQEKLLPDILDTLSGTWKDSSNLTFWQRVKGVLKTTVTTAVKDTVNFMRAELTKLITVDSDFESSLSDKLLEIAEEGLQMILEDVVDLNSLKETVLNASLPKVADSLKEFLLKAGSDLIGEVTNKALDKLSELGKLKVELPEKDPAHTFFTYAIAGAGAFNVGVAGSAALAVIKGKTTAYIVGVDNPSDFDIVVTGNTVVHSDAVHRVDTIASSSVGSNNAPDKNDTALGDADSEKDTSPKAKNTTKKFNDKDNKEHDVMVNALSVVTVTINDSAEELVITAEITDNAYKFNTKKASENAKISGFDGKDPEITVKSDGKTLKITFKKAGYTFNNILQVLISTADNQFKIEQENNGDITNPNKAFPVGSLPDKFETELSATEKIKTKTRINYTLYAPKGFVVDPSVKDKLNDIANKVLVFKDSNGTALTVKAAGEVDKMGNIVFTFAMPDKDIKLSVDFTNLEAPLFKVKAKEEIGKTESGKGVGVGAGVAVVYTDLDNQAYIKENTRIQTGTFWLDVDGGIEANTIAVSGNDPVSTHSEYYNTTAPSVGDGDFKKTSVDAGLAFAFLKGSVKAEIADTAKIKATGTDTLDVCKTILKSTGDDKQDAANKAAIADLVNFAVTSRAWSDTEARASAFSAGSTTAVGACVAVSIIELDGSVKVNGTLTSEHGTMRISAKSTSKDVVRGIASAMGSDMARLAQKFQKSGQTADAFANKVTGGEILDDIPVKKSTDTSKKTTQTLKDNQAAGGAQTNASAPTSMNALGSQNASGSNNTAVVQGNNLAAGAGTQNNTTGASQKNSYQVAAAVAVNVTKHNSNIDIAGILTFHKLDSYINNNENFATFATGTAMSLAKSSNAIAAAVAVDTNNNTAVITVKNGTKMTGHKEDVSVVDLDADGKEKKDDKGFVIYKTVTEMGDVSIAADSKANLTDQFSRYLAAQSLAGAVSGTDGKATVAGAVSIVVGNSKTHVIIEDGDSTKYVDITTDGAVEILAQSKSRLAARAGALSVSRGSSVGAGASFALVYAYDEIKAVIGSGTHITASDLTLNALKIKVTNDDYVSPGWSMLLSDTSDLSKEETQEAQSRGQLGLVSMSKDKEEGTYDIQINMDSTQLQDLLTLLPVSQVNYYVESISGAVTTGDNTKLLLAGSFAFLFAESDVQALIKDACIINLNLTSGKLAVKAADDSRSRVIAGSVAAGPSKAGVGLTAAVLVDTRKVYAQLGTGSAVQAAGVEVLAETNADDLVITVTAAVADQTAVGGAVTVEVNRSETTATIGDNVTINKDKALTDLGSGSLHVAANGGRNSIIISAAAAVAYNSGSGVGVGATLAGIYNKAVYKANVGKSVIANINGTATIESVIVNSIISLMAAITVAGDIAAGCNVSLLWDGLDSKVTIGDNTSIKAGDDITVRTNADSRVINALLTVSVAGTGAGSLILYYNELHRKAVVSIGNAVKLTGTSNSYIDDNGKTVTKNGNILVESTGKEWTLIAGAAFAAGKGATLSGNNGYTNARSEYRVEAGNGCEFTADDSIAFYAHLDQSDYIIAGALAVGTGSASLGEIVSVLTMMNKVEAATGTGVKMTALILGDGGVQTVNRSAKRKGVYIGATAAEKLLSVAANISGSSNISIGATVNVIYESNIVHAVVGDGSELRAGYQPTATSENAASGAGDIVVEADDDSHLLVIDGSVSASGNIGIGPAVVVLVFEKDVLADNRAFRILSKRDVTVTAGADDQLILVVFGVSASGSIAVAANASTLKYTNKTQAFLGRVTAGTTAADKTHITAGGDLSVTVNAEEKLINVGAEIAASGAVGVGGLVVVTLYEQTAKAIIRPGVIAADGINPGIKGNLYVTAVTKETISSDGLGVQGSGTVSVA